MNSNDLPRVHKKTSFYCCLALGFLDILDSIQKLFFGNLEQYETWWRGLPIAAVFFIAAFFLNRRNKREAIAYSEALEELKKKQAEEEAERERIKKEIENNLEKRKAQVAAEKKKYKWLYFPVAGVTFRNDDGTSRQKILKEICYGDEYGSTSASLEEYEYEGEPAIHVVTDEGIVGNIQRRNVKDVLPFFDNQPEILRVEVERFETDEGKKIYRADLAIAVLKEPNEKND